MSPIVHGSRAVKRCITSMVRELVKSEDINFDLLYFDYKGQADKRLKAFGRKINERVLGVPLRLLIPLWKRLSWPKLENILHQCDIFYTNEFYFPPTKEALVLSTIHGLPHEVIPEKISPQNAKSLKEGITFILKHADYLIAVSETTKRELINYCGVIPERIYVVTHGVDKYFRRRKNQQAVWDHLKLAYDLENPYILYVGGVAIHKNIMGILAAYKIVSAVSYHDMVIAGPPDTAWNRAQRFVNDNGLSERVRFLGNVDQTGDNLLNLYNGSDLFVFPTFYEAWTSPPLEAMACGAPVITSNCSSLPETVSDAAIKVDPNNMEELAHQMKSVLSDKLLKNTLVDRGLDHAKSHTWGKAATKMMQVFTDIKKKGPWKERRI